MTLRMVGINARLFYGPRWGTRFMLIGFGNVKKAKVVGALAFQ